MAHEAELLAEELNDLTSSFFAPATSDLAPSDLAGRKRLPSAAELAAILNGEPLPSAPAVPASTATAPVEAGVPPQEWLDALVRAPSCVPAHVFAESNAQLVRTAPPGTVQPQPTSV
jgi:hypothetical protein